MRSQISLQVVMPGLIEIHRETEEEYMDGELGEGWSVRDWEGKREGKLQLGYKINKAI